MSEADNEQLRAVYEAVSRGNWEAAFHDARPDFELIPTMRDGKPARCEVFLQREQALEAARVSE